MRGWLSPIHLEPYRPAIGLIVIIADVCDLKRLSLAARLASIELHGMRSWRLGFLVADTF
jgi:hypothetical protein